MECHVFEAVSRRLRATCVSCVYGLCGSSVAERRSPTRAPPVPTEVLLLVHTRVTTAQEHAQAHAQETKPRRPQSNLKLI